MNLTNLPRANLTDDDLQALGAIVSYWSLAELSLDMTMILLMNDPQHKQEASKLEAKRTGPFVDKIKAFKKLLRLTCQDHEKMLDMGLSLAKTGKLLSKKRKVAMHWPASRSGTASDIVRFVSTDLTKGLVQKEELSTEDIAELNATTKWEIVRPGTAIATSDMSSATLHKGGRVGLVHRVDLSALVLAFS